MQEQHDPKTGAIFFVESVEERTQREMREEFPLMKKALLLLLRKYQGPLPEDIQHYLEKVL
jgi:hypothetical protein